MLNIIHGVYLSLSWGGIVVFTAKACDPGITRFAHFLMKYVLSMADHAIHIQLKSTNRVQQIPGSSGDNRNDWLPSCKCLRKSIRDPARLLQFSVPFYLDQDRDVIT